MSKPGEPTKPEKSTESEKPAREWRAHHYRLSLPICKLGSDGCDKDRVYELLRRRPAPGSAGKEPVKKGSETDVYGLGPVEHDVDESTRKVTNTTTKRHRLFPGKVTHQVTERDGWVEIETTGEGTGPYPWANEFLAPTVWGTHIGGIRDELFPPEKGQDPPDWTT